MIPQQTINRIKDAAGDDIICIVEKYVKLKRSGSSYKGLCPFHDERTPSFSVTESMGIYKCFGCGEGGDAVAFVMKMEGMDFIEAIRHLAGMLGIIITEEHTNRPRDYVSPDQLIPGIKETKRHIRKAEKARLCFNQTEARALKQKGHQNTLFLPRFRPVHVQLIAKYTDEVIVYPKGLNRRRFLKALKVLLHSNFSIKVASNSELEPIHWLQYLNDVMDNPESMRTCSINLLSAIPDPITRNTETQFLYKVISQYKQAT